MRKITKMSLWRSFHFTIAISNCLGIAPAFADLTVLTYYTRFFPSWAEAHARTLGRLNYGGRPPFRVRWKGCIVVERGTCVDVIDHNDWSTEIVIRGKHWFTDEIPDEVIPRQSCLAGRTQREPQSITTSGEKARSH